MNKGCSTNFSESGKILWNISDVPSVGTVLRINDNIKDNNYISLTKYSDFIATKIRQNDPKRRDIDKIGFLSEGVDYDQEYSLNDKYGVDVGFNLVKPLIPGDLGIEFTRESIDAVKFSYKNVKTEQYADFLKFLTFIQSLDSMNQKDKDRSINSEANNLFHLIEEDGSREVVRADHKKSNYWIVTKVFTPSEISFSLHDNKDNNFRISCDFKIFKCGKISYKDTSTTDWKSAAKNRISFVEIRPLWVDLNHNKRVDDKVYSPAAGFVIK